MHHYTAHGIICCSMQDVIHFCQTRNTEVGEILYASFLTQEIIIQEVTDRKTQSRGVTGEVTDCTLKGEERSLLTGPQIFL